ncbi:MAG TPA: hypothetical protein VHC69_34035 [Polyangiaceae bacterium]|nr:hypothetical protein [Polyangiaceae bacterium]
MSLTVDVIADLLGVTEARVSQLRAGGFAPKATFEQLMKTGPMQRRLGAASTIVAGLGMAIAVTARNRFVLAATPGAAALFWRSEKSLLGHKMQSLVFEAPPGPANEWPALRTVEPRAPSAETYRTSFARAFGEAGDDGADDEAGRVPIRVEVRPQSWSKETPTGGLGFIGTTDAPSTSGGPTKADRDMVARLKHERPKQHWAFHAISDEYPVLGKSSVLCSVTYHDVRPSVAGRRPSAPRGDASASSARSVIRVYRFHVPPIRANMTRDILSLEYDVRSVANNEHDFSRYLRSRLTAFFQQQIEEIGQRFLCEYVTLFNFRLRGADRPKRHAEIEETGMESPRVLLPIATYGMPKMMSEREAFSLRRNEGGLIGEFLRADDPCAYRWIDFSKDRDSIKQPNLYNLGRNSRFGEALNGLLVKVRLPPQRADEHTQVYGCLRLINFFEPADPEPRLLGPRALLPWLGDLIEVAEHLAIMYQQWLRISRRWILSRAIAGLNDGSDLKTYVEWIIEELLALSEFHHVMVWEDVDGALRPLGYADPKGKVPYEGSFAGSALRRGKLVNIELVTTKTESLADEQAALQAWTDSVKARRSGGTTTPSPTKISLSNGFEIPIISARMRKWGVMSFYNTWFSPEEKVTLYRDETLDFCSALVELIAAKQDITAASS